MATRTRHKEEQQNKTHTYTLPWRIQNIRSLTYDIGSWVDGNYPHCQKREQFVRRDFSHERILTISLRQATQASYMRANDTKASAHSFAHLFFVNHKRRKISQWFFCSIRCCFKKIAGTFIRVCWSVCVGRTVYECAFSSAGENFFAKFWAHTSPNHHGKQ